LGSIYDSIGDLETSRTLWTQVASAERHPKLGRPSYLATALNKISIAHSNGGNPREAEPLAREALAIRQSISTQPSNELADAHGVLGLVLSKQRNLPEAREHLEKSLAIRQSMVPMVKKDVASALHNMGFFHADAGNMDVAVAYYQKAVDLKTEAFGPENPSTLNSIEGQGMTLLRAKRTEQAIQVLTPLYALRLKVEGPDAERTASTAAGLGEAHLNLGQYDKAADLLGFAVRIAGKVPLAERSMRYASYANLLANTHEERGNLPVAQLEYRNALSVRERVLKPDDPNIARVLFSLCRVLNKQGRTAEALPLALRGLAIRQKAFAATDALVLDAHVLLAGLYARLGDAPSAQASLAAAGTPDPAQLERVEAHQVASAALFRAKAQHSQAASMLAARAQTTAKRLGPNHPLTIAAHIEHADAADLAGQTESARQIAAAVATQMSAFDPNGITVQTWRALAKN
jgi:tetratricopeptide (TPR) repeat protein